MYRSVKYPYRRFVCSNKNDTFCHYLAVSLFVSSVTLWLIVLLNGDIELNPGPDSVEGNTDSVSSCSIDSLSNPLGIMHLNIQCITPKLSLIEGEESAYDVLVFSESWLKPDILNASICIENFSPPVRADRPDRPDEGVIVYVRSTFSS